MATVPQTTRGFTLQQTFANVRAALSPSTPAILRPDVDQILDRTEMCPDAETRRAIAESIASRFGIATTECRNNTNIQVSPDSPNTAFGGSPSEARHDFVPYRGLTSPELMRRFCHERKTSETSVRAGYWDTSLWLWLDERGLPTGEDDRDWC